MTSPARFKSTLRAQALAALWLAGSLAPGCGASDGRPRFEELRRCADWNPTRTAYFGDTHVHTAASLDANLQGTRLRAAEAYRFARGDELGVQPYDADGNSLRTLRIGRPLDFVALSDHAEFLGTTPGFTSETRFPGHGGVGSSARDRVEPVPDIIEFNGGGLAVLWAEENSREALFGAMRRREAYATSGPRILLRFFGGWWYPRTLCALGGGEFAASGYGGGVPMGGTLDARPATAGAPTFAISALRDAGDELDPATPLQRVQVVKGVVDGAGEPQSVVYEVAGDPHNGASVDPVTCDQDGSGFDTLCTVWSDPDFDPDEWVAERVVELLAADACAQWRCVLAIAAEAE